MQCWQIFSSFLIFCHYFTLLKACEITCKIWETRKFFPYCTRRRAITVTYVSRYLSFDKNVRILRMTFKETNRWSEILVETKIIAREVNMEVNILHPITPTRLKKEKDVLMQGLSLTGIILFRQVSPQFSLQYSFYIFRMQYNSGNFFVPTSYNFIG